MLKVMIKNGKSYVQLNSYGNTNYRINGSENITWGKCGSGWAIVEGVINSIEKKYIISGEITTYKRSIDAPRNLPEYLDVSDIVEDDDGYKTCSLGYDLDYYIPQYPEEIASWIPVEFEIIDRDCEPVNLPLWCSIDWPANIEHYKEVQHKYPCHTLEKPLFNELALEIKELCNNNKNLIFTDYLNIGILHVDMLVDIPKSLQKQSKEEYYPTFRSKKTKTRYVTYTTKKIRILTLNGFYANERTGDCVVLIPIFRGSNFEELKKQVDKFKQEILSMIDTNKYQICETCGGKGIHIC